MRSIRTLSAGLVSVALGVFAPACGDQLVTNQDTSQGAVQTGATGSTSTPTTTPATTPTTTPTTTDPTTTTPPTATPPTTTAPTPPPSTCTTTQDTYANFAQQFIMVHCHDCHSGMYDTLASVESNESQIRGSISNGSMPLGGATYAVTAADKTRIVAWLNCPSPLP